MVKRTRKNKILKIIVYINLIIFLTSACMIDSASWIPSIVCVVTGGYLTLFIYANNGFYERRR